MSANSPALRIATAIQDLCDAFEAAGLNCPVAIVVEAGQTIAIEAVLRKGVTQMLVEDRKSDGMLTVAGVPLIEV